MLLHECHQQTNQPWMSLDPILSGETLFGLRESLTSATDCLTGVDSSVAVSSAGELFLRFISLTSLEHQVECTRKVKGMLINNHWQVWHGCNRRFISQFLNPYTKYMLEPYQWYSVHDKQVFSGVTGGSRTCRSVKRWWRSEGSCFCRRSPCPEPRSPNSATRSSKTAQWVFPKQQIMCDRGRMNCKSRVNRTLSQYINNDVNTDLNAFTHMAKELEWSSYPC